LKIGLVDSIIGSQIFSITHHMYRNFVKVPPATAI